MILLNENYPGKGKTKTVKQSCECACGRVTVFDSVTNTPVKVLKKLGFYRHRKSKQMFKRTVYKECGCYDLDD